LRCMRKPYKTPTYLKDDSNPLMQHSLCGIGCCVLSGSNTRKRVYPETIETVISNHMITPEFLIEISKKLKILADSVAMATPQLSFELNIDFSEFSNVYPDEKMQKLTSWSKQQTNCKFIYVFSLSSEVDIQNLVNLYESAKKREKEIKGKRAFARLNDPSRTLYVGSSNLLPSRIKQHLGYGNQRIFSMQLKHWLPASENIRISLKAWSFNGSISQPVLQAIEDSLWSELKPMLGKQGSK